MSAPSPPAIPPKPPLNPLLAHLHHSFSQTPIPHPLTVTLLSSVPKPTKSLFPYTDAPKCFMQEMLVVVAADVKQEVKVEKKEKKEHSAERGRSTKRDVEGGNSSSGSTSSMLTRSQSRKRIEDAESISSPAPATATTTTTDTVTKESQARPPKIEEVAKKRIILCALETYIYTIPSTSTTIVYISKVDSTGYSPYALPSATASTSISTTSTIPITNGSTTTGTNNTSPPRLPPTTRTLLTSFLTHILSPLTSPTKNVHVQLFARSQNQYLFPNSILGGGKKVGGGVKLCKWWRGVLEDVAREITGVKGKKVGSQDDQARNGHAGNESDRSASSFPTTIKLTSLLPSYDANEARSLLGSSAPNALPDGVCWTYGPPNAPDEIGGLFPFVAGAARTGSGQDGKGANVGQAVNQNMEVEKAGEQITGVRNEQDQDQHQDQPSQKPLDDTKESSAAALATATAKARRNIARLIPVFEDDPKARFLYEVVESASGKGVGGGTRGRKDNDNAHRNKRREEEEKEDSEQPEVKRRKLIPGTDGDKMENKMIETETEPEATTVDQPMDDPLRRVRSRSTSLPANRPPIQPPIGNTSIALNHREKRKLEAFNLRCDDERALEQLGFDKFWELMGYRQECASGDVTGFFSMSRVPAYLAQMQAEEIISMLEKDKDKATPKSKSFELSQEVFARLLASLLNYDFANRDLAIISSERYLESVKNIVEKEVGKEGWERGCTIRVDKNGIEVGAGTAANSSGSVGTSDGNGQVAAPVQQINVLQVRKKKKPVQG